MAIDHAQELKNKDIKIYTIGLGSVDKTLLGAIASGKGFEYYTQLQINWRPFSKRLLRR